MNSLSHYYWFPSLTLVWSSQPDISHKLKVALNINSFITSFHDILLCEAYYIILYIWNEMLLWLNTHGVLFTKCNQAVWFSAPESIKILYLTVMIWWIWTNHLIPRLVDLWATILVITRVRSYIWWLIQEDGNYLLIILI